MRIVFTILVFGLCLNSCQNRYAMDEPDDQPQDVLFIVVDDLNDWVNCLGGRAKMITPNIDKLASEALLFSNAHCTSPACCPSRTSVLTGVSPSTSGIYSNRHEWRKSSVLENAKTIPEYFSEQGYVVKGTGKIFHALSWIQQGYGIDQNDPEIWDEFWPSKHRQLPESLWPDKATKNSKNYVRWPVLAGSGTLNRPPDFFDFGPLGDDDQMADFKVVDWAMKQIQKDYNSPLFLAVGIYRPHIPWFVPKQYFDLYPLDSIILPSIREDDLEDVPDHALTWLRQDWQEWMIKNDQWKSAIQAYCASVSFADAQIGRLMDCLKKSRRADNTIVVLWSDHGMHLGEKEQWEKFTLWEESTRVPLILKVPGLTPIDGGLCTEAVSLLDVFPTLIDLIGNNTFDQLEGTSLLPFIVNPDTTREEPAITTFHFNNHSVRTERWRYIKYSNGEEELYDHRNDPDEFYNLASMSDYRAIMDELKAWLPKINYIEE